MYKWADKFSTPKKPLMSRKMVYILAGDVEKRRIWTLFLRGLGLRVEPVSDIEIPALSGDSGDILVWAVPAPDAAFNEKLRGLLATHPELRVILILPPGVSGKALNLLKEGLVGQISGSGDPMGLYSAIRSEQEKASLKKTKEIALRRLKHVKRELAAELGKAAELEDIYEATLENFMAALDLRDVETFGHSKTVSRYSYVLAESLGIKEPKILDNIRKGALLHDAGKIAIPDTILKKPGPLTDEEWAKVRRHPALGFGLLKDVKLVREVGNIILCHHEKYDGTGYPRGLKAEGIPIEARVFALADALDAITSHRPYRAPRDFESARSEIIGKSGSHFDPRVVEAFQALDMAVWEKIRFETTRLIPPIALAYRGES